jgi:hypothetical protein
MSPSWRTPALASRFAISIRAAFLLATSWPACLITISRRPTSFTSVDSFQTVGYGYCARFSSTETTDFGTPK